MKNPVWAKAFKASADPQRARHGHALLVAAGVAGELERATAEEARILCALWSGSQALSGWLVAHPELVAMLKPELLAHPRRDQGFRREVDEWLDRALAARDYAGAFSRLRHFKHREMLRIAARDLSRLARVPEIIRELSDVADVCLNAVWRLCDLQMTERLGHPFHQDPEGRWHPTGLAILGMGKLGGQELNYSSDVDVLFVYSEDGQVFKQPPARNKTPATVMSNVQYFKLLAESFTAEVRRMSPEGMLYRIDLRLRPEGATGPLARSLASYENYYAQWGQTWERMMLIKARGVAGDLALAAEFLETIQPFRYPRSMDEGVLREVAAMKDRIEREVVKSGELDRNVKLGRGGIREIEFVAQTLQLLNAGRLPFLQGTQTLPALEKLAQYDLLSFTEARSLAGAYDFLRDVEHRLQMEDNLQTHTIPLARAAQERLARLMGCKSLKEFEAARAEHTRDVRKIYDRLLGAEIPGPASTLPREFDGYEAEWKAILEQHCFQQVAQALRMLKEFAFGPGYVHVSNRTTELALQLLPKMFALCLRAGATDRPTGPQDRVLSDPDRVLTRLDGFIAAYGARSTLFEMWARHPALFELLLLLFDRSEFLAETAIRAPDLVEELVLSGRLRLRKTAEETLKDLRHGRADADQRLWLRLYHRAEFMRIGLRDILGLADIEQNLFELTALADACLQYALEVVMRQHRVRVPVAIIGLGKLGGAEINYGSDLDILFVTDAKERELPKLQRIAVEVMEMLSSVTELGVAFHTDARLRPDGDKGLLVNTLTAYENYYRQRAQLWEIQSISRTRPIAGSRELGVQFQKLAALLTDFRPENIAAGFPARTRALVSRKSAKLKSKFTGKSAGLAAYSKDWRDKVRRMRERIEKERTPPGQDALAIKTGSGGLMDAEFIAQTFSLANGWHEASTLRALERARETTALGRSDADLLIRNYRELRRVEGILRRWSFEGETVLPADEPAFRRVAIRCGFATTAKFREALQGFRRTIRSVYAKALPA